MKSWRQFPLSFPGLCLAWSLFGFAGCSLSPAEPPARADSWPFYREHFDPVSGAYRLDAAGPFITRRDGATGGSAPDETTLRPFYSYLHDPVKQDIDRIALHPLGRWRTAYRDGPPGDETRKEQVWLLPFFYFSYFSPRPGEYERDYFAPFPLVVGSDSGKEGSAFALMPLAGNLKGLFGNDEITFALGPLYVEVRRGENRTWYFPFPLLRYGEGPGYRSFGVLPLYSFSGREGKWERHHLAFPLISWGKERLDTAHPQQYWFFWPVAGRVWTDQTSLFSVLPPFFNFGYAASTSTTLIDAPWPIFRWAKGDQYEEFRLWPLYARARRNDNWTTELLWPFIWHFDEHDDKFTEQRFWILPVFWSRFRQYTPEADGTARRESDVTVWPLARYSRGYDEHTLFRFPFLLPYIDQRFERLYRDLVTLLKVESTPDSTSFEMLWGAANYHNDAWETSWALHPLMRYHSAEARPEAPARLTLANRADLETGDAASGQADASGGDTRFDLLYGLLGYGREAEKRYARLLWFIKIPF